MKMIHTEPCPVRPCRRTAGRTAQQRGFPSARHHIAAITLALLTLLLAGCRQEIVRQDGVEYLHATNATPWSIHAVACDLAREDIAVLATVGTGVKGSETLGQMMDGLPRAWGEPLAAINGDYFEFKTEPRYFGTVQGMCIVDGELVSAGSGLTFWIDAQRKPHVDGARTAITLTWSDGKTTPLGLNCSTTDYKSEVHAANVVLYTPAFGSSTGTEAGRELVLEPAERGPWLPLQPNTRVKARVKEVCTAGDTPIPPRGMVISVARKADGAVPAARVGDLLVIETVITPDMTGAHTAISGDPRILKDGQLLPNLDNTNRAPRTAVGIAGTRVVFLVVDGRQPKLSVGMTHRELGEVMLRQGCTDAINLDGGGSSALWYNGAIVNSPSDGRPRPVGNALVMLRTGKR